jgi:MinD-like ATPase involved in chromosome partitioning or flagellar assembly
MNDNPVLTRFVAFYSYKGGVGRTLALANCARMLAAGGKRVLLMDFDLEAPGLQHFQVFRPKKTNENVRLPGFSEYLEDCLKNGPPSLLTDYIHESQGQKTDRDHGMIWLMPAGRHEEPGYLSFLNGKSWSDFYSLQEGYKILENLRGQIVEEYQPDYVLMDARTGLSEIGGIATHQLADIVVLVFNLNSQNLAGALRVFKSIQTAPMNPKIILVVSPVPVVPVAKGTLFEKKMSQISKDFQGAHNADQPLVIPYHPMLAFSERILADDCDDPFSSDAPYRQLTDLIKELANDPDIYLAKANEAERKGDISIVKDNLLEGLKNNPGNPYLLYSLAWQYYQQNEYQKSIDICSFILQKISKTKQPDLQLLEAKTLFNKSVALMNLGYPEDAVEVHNYIFACFGNSQRSELQEAVARTLLFQGFILKKLEKDKESLTIYELLLEKFGDSDRPEFLNNYIARALTRKLSILVEMRRHEEILLTAEQFLARFGGSDRFELQERIAMVLNSKGNTLGNLGRDEEALATYDQVVVRFAHSQEPELKKQVGKALVNQGAAFICLAKREKLASRLELFSQRLEQANTALEQAKQYLNKDAIVIKNQAYLLFLRGECEPATILLKKAIQLSGNEITKGCHENSQTHHLPEDGDFLIFLNKLAQ